MINKMNFENYSAYLLSVNIAQVAREFGFKKVGMNSLYLLTHLVKTYIEDVAILSKSYCELGGRAETNLIDVLFALMEKQIDKDKIMAYLGETRIKYRFAKQMYIGKIYSSEERERNNLQKKINSGNVLHSEAIPESLASYVPRSLRVFPSDFALRETETKTEPTDETKKMRSQVKNAEKKSLEEIISSNNYYDLSKKHTRRKQSVDVNNLFVDAVKSDNINLGKKFKPAQKLDKQMVRVEQQAALNENGEKGNLIAPQIESDLNEKSNYNIEDSNII